VAKNSRLFKAERFFAGMKPDEVERALRELNDTWRDATLGILNRLEREPGHKRRLAEWNRSNRSQFEVMRLAHEHGNVFAKFDALELSQAIGVLPPKWAVDAILRDAINRFKVKRPRTTQLQGVSDWMARALVDELRSQGVSQLQAWARVGKRFHLSASAIRAACERAKRRGNSYFSAVAASVQ